MQKEFIVYTGEKYTIEWFVDERGRSLALEYFDALDDARQKKTMHLFMLYGDRGAIFNEEKFTCEDDKIFAFKPAPDRFLCFFYVGAKIIITNAYQKQSKKMPPREKERALKCKKNYEERVKKGIYYGR